MLNMGQVINDILKQLKDSSADFIPLDSRQTDTQTNSRQCTLLCSLFVLNMIVSLNN